MEPLGNASTDQLVAKYREAAAVHGGGELREDTPITNRSADTIAAVYRELRHREAEAALLVLLDDPNPAVRSWAAAHALEFAPSEGETVLQALADDDDLALIGFTAKITLEQWRAGRLLFP
jgi:hypothetical protein